MHKITLLTVGTLREPWAKDAARMYRERLRGVVDCNVLELPPSRQPNASGQIIEESERMIKSLEKMDGDVWVLDERGKSLSSEEFSKEIGMMKDRGTPIIFILGGAYGLSDQLRSRAQKIISLSAMTLPHELCRVLLLEQLYRAHEIAKGSGYHH